MIKVLLVDDDPMVLEIIRNYIESISDYNVVGMERDGLAALTFLESTFVNLIVVDIYMPKMDGITFIRELRKKQINSDVMVATSSNDTENISTALKYGAIDYLVKPFDYERLKQTMENFRKRFITLKTTTSIDQNVIDRITNTHVGRYNLPKGIHQATLDSIREYIDRINDGMEFSAEDVSRELGISVVTLRHYFEYFTRTGIIVSRVRYGSVGRPKYIYSKNTGL